MGEEIAKVSTVLGKWKVGGRGVTDLAEEKKPKCKCLQSWGIPIRSEEICPRGTRGGGIKGEGKNILLESFSRVIRSLKFSNISPIQMVRTLFLNLADKGRFHSGKLWMKKKSSAKSGLLGTAEDRGPDPKQNKTWKMRPQTPSSAVKNTLEEAYTAIPGENECAPPHTKRPINRNI